MFRKLKQGGNETVFLGNFAIYRRTVRNLSKTDYRKKIYLLGLPFSVYSHSEIEGKSKWRLLGIQVSKRKPAADTAIRPEESCLNDSFMRLAGHDGDTARIVYLATGRSRRPGLPKPKKVLLIGHEFSVTGAPAFLLELARLLISQGYRVDIAVKESADLSAIHMYDGIGADVALLPDSTECFAGAESCVRGYDLVIVNTIVMGAYADLCHRLNIPHIWYIHEDLPSIQTFFRIIGGCRERFEKDSENILCVSRYVSDCVYSEYRIRCRYINNFVNDFYSPAEQKKGAEADYGRVRTFAVVGSVYERKSQITAAAAFMYLSAVPEYKGRWKLLFIGNHGRAASNPDLGEKLDKVTKNLPDVVWCGQVTENKWDLFRTADFFIVPSLEESSSLVAIEAAMLGKPVIVSSHVGAKYLTDGGAGFVFEPGDAAGLRELVMKCIDLPRDEYSRMSRQIRLNYEKTSTPAIYLRNLDEAIADAAERCRLSSAAEESSGSGIMALKYLGQGGNTISFDRFEYVKFADFADFAPETDSRSVKEPAGQKELLPVGVVVPVYNGTEHLKVLLPSLFKNTDLPHRFIFVDDCSKSETADFLSDAIKGHDDCILLKNSENLGFVKSVNRGAAKALEESCGSFVMLNSDTEVPSGWLSRLIRPMAEDETVASVTPLSNRATVFSFPFMNDNNDDLFLKEFGLEGINASIRSACAERYPELPTGHGFCMAVSSRVWKKIGGLNEALFGRGYGEENEWCQRAELDGFRNVLNTSLYVAHHEKGSFTSEERKANCEASLEVISVMFPSYMQRVYDFTRENPSADAIAATFISLALQKGCRPEVFTDPELFRKRLSGEDGIFLIRQSEVTKVAAKLLGYVIFIGNARHIEKIGLSIEQKAE